MTQRRLHAAALKACTPLLEPLALAGAELHMLSGRELLATTNPETTAAEALACLAQAHGGNSVVSSRWWYDVPLQLGAQARKALLVMALPAPAANETALAIFADALEREWRHAEAEDSLSVELGNRYEELNLLYGIDNVLDQNVDTPLRTLIGDALRDCVEFLDIEAATIWAPRYGLTERAFDGGGSELESLLTEDHQRQLKKVLRGHENPLVLNGGVGDPLGIEGVSLPCRVVAAPISQGQDRVAGVLCLLRRFCAGPFTNGDRKLARVLAAEMTKALDGRFDFVTGLVNRESFEKVLQSRDIWGDDLEFGSLIHCDLDQFKLINDACGHEAGDRLLKMSAQLLRKVAPPGTVIARIGADEFATVLPGYTAEQSRELALATQDMLTEQRFIDREKSFQVTASTGITEFNRHSDVSNALIEAELACQSAKELGGARVRVYQHGDQQVVARHSEMRWASEIRAAIEDDRLELFGQAICHTSDPDGEPAHFEVLLRMFDLEQTMVSPAIFIPAAERYGLISKIDRLVVTKALDTLAGCRARGADIRLTVNLSGASIADEEFRQYVTSALSTAPITRGALSFEITETAAISSVSQALGFINEMKNFGCRFLLDDFGAGMSSYSYLRQFPVDYVKIDGSFVKNVDSDNFNRSIVESIHHICVAAGKQTVAEFVENDAVLATLQDIGVDLVQGYRLDKPSPLQDKIAARFPELKASA